MTGASRSNSTSHSSTVSRVSQAIGRRAHRSDATRADGARLARRLCRDLDALWRAFQSGPRRAIRHRRVGGLVAPPRTRLRQTSTVRGLADARLVLAVPDQRVVLLFAGHGLCGARAVDRLAPVRALSRSRQARRRAGLSRAGAVLQFSGLRFDHNAVLGALWAATALCFIRSYEMRSATWAAGAGPPRPPRCSANTGRSCCWPVSRWR